MPERISQPAPNDHEMTAFAAELNEDVPQVDLHGQTVDQAVHALDQALNHAFMHGDEALRVLHGRGSGVLRKAVHDFLRQQTQLVAYFRDADAVGQQGGLTVVVLHSKNHH